MRGIILCLTAAVLLLNAGCRSPLPENPPPDAWTPSQLENQLAGTDPIEPFNRSMFAVQHFGMNWVVDPIGRVYTSIFPRPFIEKFHNLCVNLEFPGRCFSNLLRTEWTGAGDEALRFLLNTTVGIAGLFDVAANWWDIHPTGSTFGQTFHDWKMASGCTLILPFLGSLNFRDAGGSILDAALDIKTYIPYAGYATMLNRAVVAHKAYTALTEGSCDPYKTYRQMMVFVRELQLRMWVYRARNAAAAHARAVKEKRIVLQPEIPVSPRPAPAKLRGNWIDLPAFGTADPLLSSLRVMLFRASDNNGYWYMKLSFFNRDFSNRCEKRQAEIAPGRPPLTYAFWNAKEQPKGTTPKLAVVLPGIGGTWFGQTTMALSELLYRNGFSVVALDSTFTWQFLESANDGKLPGYLDADAKQLRKTIGRVLKDLEAEGKTDLPEVTVIGYSFGAMHLMKIADQEKEDPTLDIHRYVAINPPVSLKQASSVADRYAEAGRKWSPAAAIDRLVNLTGTMLTVASTDFTPQSARTSPLLSPEESAARFIAGLYFKLSMRELLFSAHREKALPALKEPYQWGRRNALYLEIDQVSFKDYAEKFLAPQYPEVPLAELYSRSDLRSFRRNLRRLPELRVIHNYDDILLSDSDRVFLDETLGKRLYWFSRGGHLGNLYLPKVQELIVKLSAGE